MPDVVESRCRRCFGLRRCQWCLGSGEEKVAEVGSGKGIQTRPCRECAPGFPGRCSVCQGTGERP